jgi:hypothetical protein
VLCCSLDARAGLPANSLMGPRRQKIKPGKSRA